MAKCDSYFQHGTKFLCYGTKEMEECSCGGDTSRCDFYPEKRVPKMELEPCPFCGAKLRDEWLTVHQLLSGGWQVYHTCEHQPGDLGVCINVYGPTKKEAVDRWNHRAGEVANGQQT